MNTTLTRATVAAALLLLAGCASSTPSSDAASANPTVGITTRSTVVSGSGQVVTASATPTTQANALGQQISAWWTGGAEARANKITADLSSMTTDSSDPTAVGNDCQTLSGDISNAQSYKPVPDQQTQHHWSAALDKYQQGATDCIAGVATTSADLLNKAGTEIAAGTAELNAATARILQIGAGG